MKVIVCPLRDVRDVYTQANATHLLSILDPNEHISHDWGFVTAHNWYLIQCRDVLDDTIIDCPKHEQVEKVLRWAKGLPDDSILVVHCHAGISRSTAMAIAILVQRGWTIEAAILHVKSMRKLMAPNPIITKIADSILKMGGQLHQQTQEACEFPYLLQKC